MACGSGAARESPPHLRQDQVGGMRGCLWAASHAAVLADCGWADDDAEFEELAGDAFSAPADVVEEHLLDESDGGLGGRWWMSVVVGFGLASPDEAKQVTMPAQRGVGMDHEEGCFPGV